MPNIYLIHHMKRSGGHAIINWLMTGSPQPAFVNNAIPIQPILERRAPVPDRSASFANWARRQPDLPRSLDSTTEIFVSLEDHELHVSPFHLSGIQRVVIVRHPRNLFASRIRKASRSRFSAYRLDDPFFVERAKRIWKAHAREASNVVSSAHAILYEAWLTSPSYRATLAEQFGFAGPPDLSDQIAEEGMGSSFEDKSVQVDDLLRRDAFLSGAELQVLASILADPEIAELGLHLSRQIDALGGRCDAEGPDARDVA
jgi:hypothetical protein